MRAGTVLLCIGVWLSTAAADQLVFSSGKESAQGRVVSIDSRNIVFEDPVANGTKTFDRSSISEIRWSNLSSALQLAAQPGADPSAGLEFQRGAVNALEHAQKSIQANQLEAAYADYKSLYDALTNQQLRAAAIRAMGGQEPFQRLTDSSVSGLTDVSYKLYTAMSQDPNKAKDAVGYLSAAAQASKNWQYYYQLATVSEKSRDFRTAVACYQFVLNAAQVPGQYTQAAQQAIARINQESGGAYATGGTAPQGTAIAMATGAPARSVTPVPGTGVVSGRPGAPTPAAPAPKAPIANADGSPILPAGATPTPAPASGNKFKDILAQVQGSARSFGSDVANGAYNQAIIVVVLVIALGWVLPFLFLAFKASRGDFFAAEYKPLAKKIGLLALVPYFRKSRTRTEPKDKCPNCGRGIDNIEMYQDLNFYVCPHCRENITPIYDLQDYVTHLISQLNRAAQKGGSGNETATFTLEKDAMSKLVRGVLTLAVRRRASDLQAEVDQDMMRIRARIDGIMYELMQLPRTIANAFVSAIKVMSNLDITERRLPQDGKMSLYIDKADVDLRIATSPATMGEKVSIRILNQKTVLSDPRGLGLDDDQFSKYTQVVHRPNGLAIVTGPAGSGKSTTLFVALNELNTGEKNIITIEDPVEYQIKGISQLQVNPAADFTFSTGLRSILRQDPDVIMVGEIRDRETAEIAMDAATTGHLVFTTLHTIDAPTAFARLTDLGAEPRRMASAVSCIIAQRLIRTVCMECAKVYTPKKADLEMLGLSATANGHQFVHGVGCENCMKTGYFGRTGIFEFLIPNDQIRELLEANASPSAIRDVARKFGFKSLREEGIVKIYKDQTTAEEVIRMTAN